ncbi:MAG: phosphate signaling complex protein PhoU [Thermoguttaceae bacterium]
MSAHFQREISKLKQQVLLLCTQVEGQVEKAVRAVQMRDDELAEEVERLDEEIDLREIEVEEECLKTLALYQPVAGDLRFVVSALKINHDLERIGDLAVNIARKVRGLVFDPPPELTCDLGLMCEKTQLLLRDSIDSLVSLNASEAATICTRDDEIDQMKATIRKEIETAIKQQPDKVGSLLRLLAVSRNLERIADLATSISEDVVYLVEGRIMRHPTLTAVRNGTG